jgi:3-methyladenine DNA glycosylase/8-oxoguanine DNA glycosylase
VGDVRRRAHGPQPHRVRGRGEDGLHDELRLVGDGPDGARDRDAPWRAGGRAGYRGAYLVSLSRAVADGEIDLEWYGRASADELPDAELEERLLALPGVGPYAAAHIMMTLGRYHRLILDSWTRPTYAKKAGRRAVTDAAIARRFRPYGAYAGLAFWLFLTRDWVEEPVVSH